MKKKLLALLLVLSMLLTLMASCKSNTSEEENTPDVSPESSQPNQPEKTGYGDEELVRAAACGFGEYREDDSTVTYQEFMAMLDRAVTLVDPD